MQGILDSGFAQQIEQTRNATTKGLGSVLGMGQDESVSRDEAILCPSAPIW